MDIDAIKEKFIQNLELKDVIMRTADSLYNKLDERGTKMTIQQIIEMITLFYVAPSGCYEEEMDEYPGAKEFVDAGYAELDEEEADFYVISDAGDEFLFPHIKQIAEDLVTYMYDAGGECTDDEIQKWCAEKYQIKNEETVQLLTFFMCDKLNHFGWEASRIYSTEKGWFRRLEELSDAE